MTAGKHHTARSNTSAHATDVAAIEAFQHRIGYRFARESLLVAALTHRSVLNELPGLRTHARPALESPLEDEGLGRSNTTTMGLDTRGVASRGLASRGVASRGVASRAPVQARETQARDARSDVQAGNAHERASAGNTSEPSQAAEPSEADNERLEFLGDAMLDAVIAEALFRLNPNDAEGALSRKRAALVCEASLHRKAAELDIGPAIRLGRGEEKTGGRHKPRLLASALEACLGAIALDGGYLAVREVILTLFARELPATAYETDDPKTALQRRCQSMFRQDPLYRIVAEHGPAHAKTFEAEVLVDGRLLATASAPSKSLAMREAAATALQRSATAPHHDETGRREANAMATVKQAAATQASSGAAPLHGKPKKGAEGPAKHGRTSAQGSRRKATRGRKAR